MNILNENCLLIYLQSDKLIDLHFLRPQAPLGVVNQSYMTAINIHEIFIYTTVMDENSLSVPPLLVQWHDSTFLKKLVWSINNHFFAFFNSS